LNIDHGEEWTQPICSCFDGGRYWRLGAVLTMTMMILPEPKTFGGLDQACHCCSMGRLLLGAIVADDGVAVAVAEDARSGCLQWPGGLRD